MQKQPINELGWLIDPNSIEWVTRYNSLLQYIDKLIPVEKGSIPAPVFIIGPPRSGTTLVYQLIAQCLDVGYINNFIARFWQAPILGTYLSERIYKVSPDEDFISSFGRTEGLGGVHEFGYFWRRFFDSTHSDYAEEILLENKLKLQREVHSMSSIFGRRLVFKNLTCGLRILPLSESFPGAIFIQVKRDIIENAISILKARRVYRGSERAWWSLIPKEIENLRKLSVESQIRAQIFSTYEAINRQIQAIGATLITIEYERACREPSSVIEMLADELQVMIRKIPEKEFVPATHLPSDDPLEKNLIEVFNKGPNL
ncbi:MAG: sulfotransferase [Candidatus Hodarchaeota archaeon]